MIKHAKTCLDVTESPPKQNGRHFADDIFKFMFMNEMFCISYQSFTEVCSQGSEWQKDNVGLSDGLAPNMRQALTWSNVDPVYWRIYAALGQMR